LPPPTDFNPGWSKPDHPITNVTWGEAVDYCAWIGGELPTEAQWKYAARGGADNQKFPWGDKITAEMANYSESRLHGTTPVRKYAPNAWELYDMAGNVHEWMAEWYDEDYYKSLPGPADQPVIDPLGPPVEPSSKWRGLCGGSYNSPATGIRTSFRDGYTPGLPRGRGVGFRCVLKSAR
jgi:sulfatase modifying factor 1